MNKFLFESKKKSSNKNSRMKKFAYYAVVRRLVKENRMPNNLREFLIGPVLGIGIFPGSSTDKIMTDDGTRVSYFNIQAAKNMWSYFMSGDLPSDEEIRKELLSIFEESNSGVVSYKPSGGSGQVTPPPISPTVDPNQRDIEVEDQDNTPVIPTKPQESPQDPPEGNTDTTPPKPQSEGDMDSERDTDEDGDKDIELSLSSIEDQESKELSNKILENIPLVIDIFFDYIYQQISESYMDMIQYEDEEDLVLITEGYEKYAKELVDQIRDLTTFEDGEVSSEILKTLETRLQGLAGFSFKNKEDLSSEVENISSNIQSISQDILISKYLTTDLEIFQKETKDLSDVLLETLKEGYSSNLSDSIFDFKNKEDSQDESVEEELLEPTKNSGLLNNKLSEVYEEYILGLRNVAIDMNNSGKDLEDIVYQFSKTIEIMLDTKTFSSHYKVSKGLVDAISFYLVGDLEHFANVFGPQSLKNASFEQKIEEYEKRYREDSTFLYKISQLYSSSIKDKLNITSDDVDDIAKHFIIYCAGGELEPKSSIKNKISQKINLYNSIEETVTTEGDSLTEDASEVLDSILSYMATKISDLKGVSEIVPSEVIDGTESEITYTRAKPDRKAKTGYSTRLKKDTVTISPDLIKQEFTNSQNFPIIMNLLESLSEKDSSEIKEYFQYLLNSLRSRYPDYMHEISSDFSSNDVNSEIINLVSEIIYIDIRLRALGAIYVSEDETDIEQGQDNIPAIDDREDEQLSGQDEELSGQGEELSGQDEQSEELSEELSEQDEESSEQDEEADLETTTVQPINEDEAYTILEMLFAATNYGNGIKNNRIKIFHEDFFERGPFEVTSLSVNRKDENPLSVDTKAGKKGNTVSLKELSIYNAKEGRVINKEELSLIRNNKDPKNKVSSIDSLIPQLNDNLSSLLVAAEATTMPDSGDQESEDEQIQIVEQEQPIASTDLNANKVFELLKEYDIEEIIKLRLTDIIEELSKSENTTDLAKKFIEYGITKDVLILEIAAESAKRSAESGLPRPLLGREISFKDKTTISLNDSKNLIMMTEAISMFPEIQESLFDEKVYVNVKDENFLNSLLDSLPSEEEVVQKNTNRIDEMSEEFVLNIENAHRQIISLNISKFESEDFNEKYILKPATFRKILGMLKDEDREYIKSYGNKKFYEIIEEKILQIPNNKVLSGNNYLNNRLSITSEEEMAAFAREEYEKYKLTLSEDEDPSLEDPLSEESSSERTSDVEDFISMHARRSGTTKENLLRYIEEFEEFAKNNGFLGKELFKSIISIQKDAKKEEEVEQTEKDYLLGPTVLKIYRKISENMIIDSENSRARRRAGCISIMQYLEENKEYNGMQISKSTTDNLMTTRFGFRNIEEVASALEERQDTSVEGEKKKIEKAIETGDSYSMLIDLANKTNNRLVGLKNSFRNKLSDSEDPMKDFIEYENDLEKIVRDFGVLSLLDLQDEVNNYMNMLKENLKEGRGIFAFDLYKIKKVKDDLDDRKIEVSNKFYLNDKSSFEDIKETIKQNLEKIKELSLSSESGSKTKAKNIAKTMYETGQITRIGFNNIKKAINNKGGFNIQDISFENIDKILPTFAHAIQEGAEFEHPDKIQDRFSNRVYEFLTSPEVEEKIKDIEGKVYDDVSMEKIGAGKYRVALLPEDGSEEKEVNIEYISSLGFNFEDIKNNDLKNNNENIFTLEEADDILSFFNIQNNITYQEVVYPIISNDEDNGHMRLFLEKTVDDDLPIYPDAYLLRSDLNNVKDFNAEEFYTKFDRPELDDQSEVIETTEIETDTTKPPFLEPEELQANKPKEEAEEDFGEFLDSQVESLIQSNFIEKNSLDLPDGTYKMRGGGYVPSIHDINDNDTGYRLVLKLGIRGSYSGDEFEIKNNSITSYSNSIPVVLTDSSQIYRILFKSPEELTDADTSDILTTDSQTVVTDDSNIQIDKEEDSQSAEEAMEQIDSSDLSELDKIRAKIIEYLNNSKAFSRDTSISITKIIQGIGLSDSLDSSEKAEIFKSTKDGSLINKMMSEGVIFKANEARAYTNHKFFLLIKRVDDDSEQIIDEKTAPEWLNKRDYLTAEQSITNIFNGSISGLKQGFITKEDFLNELKEQARSIIDGLSLTDDYQRQLIEFIIDKIQSEDSLGDDYEKVSDMVDNFQSSFDDIISKPPESPEVEQPEDPNIDAETDKDIISEPQEEASSLDPNEVVLKLQEYSTFVLDTVSSGAREGEQDLIDIIDSLEDPGSKALLEEIKEYIQRKDVLMVAKDNQTAELFLEEIYQALNMQINYPVPSSREKVNVASEEEPVIDETNLALDSLLDSSDHDRVSKELERLSLKGGVSDRIRFSDAYHDFISYCISEIYPKFFDDIISMIENSEEISDFKESYSFLGINSDKNILKDEEEDTEYKIDSRKYISLKKVKELFDGKVGMEALSEMMDSDSEIPKKVYSDNSFVNEGSYSLTDSLDKDRGAIRKRWNSSSNEFRDVCTAIGNYVDKSRNIRIVSKVSFSPEKYDEKLYKKLEREAKKSKDNRKLLEYEKSVQRERVIDGGSFYIIDRKKEEASRKEQIQIIKEEMQSENSLILNNNTVSALHKADERETKKYPISPTGIVLGAMNALFSRDISTKPVRTINDHEKTPSILAEYFWLKIQLEYKYRTGLGYLVRPRITEKGKTPWDKVRDSLYELKLDSIESITSEEVSTINSISPNLSSQPVHVILTALALNVSSGEQNLPEEKANNSYMLSSLHKIITYCFTMAIKDLGGKLNDKDLQLLNDEKAASNIVASGAYTSKEPIEINYSHPFITVNLNFYEDNFYSVKIANKSYFADSEEYNEDTGFLNISLLKEDGSIKDEFRKPLLDGGYFLEKNSNEDLIRKILSKEAIVEYFADIPNINDYRFFNKKEEAISSALSKLNQANRDALPEHQDMLMGGGDKESGARTVSKLLASIRNKDRFSFDENDFNNYIIVIQNFGKYKYISEDNLKRDAYAVINNSQGDNKYIFIKGSLENENVIYKIIEDGEARTRRLSRLEFEFVPDLKLERSQTRRRGETYYGVKIIGDFYSHKIGMTGVDENQETAGMQTLVSALRGSSEDYLDIIVVDNEKDAAQQYLNYKFKEDGTTSKNMNSFSVNTSRLVGGTYGDKASFVEKTYEESVESLVSEINNLDIFFSARRSNQDMNYEFNRSMYLLIKNFVESVFTKIRSSAIQSKKEKEALGKEFRYFLNLSPDKDLLKGMISLETLYEIIQKNLRRRDSDYQEKIEDAINEAFHTIKLNKILNSVLVSDEEIKRLVNNYILRVLCKYAVRASSARGILDKDQKLELSSKLFTDYVINEEAIEEIEENERPPLLTLTDRERDVAHLKLRRLNSLIKRNSINRAIDRLDQDQYLDHYEDLLAASQSEEERESIKSLYGESISILEKALDNEFDSEDEDAPDLDFSGAARRINDRLNQLDKSKEPATIERPDVSETLYPEQFDKLKEQARIDVTETLQPEETESVSQDIANTDPTPNKPTFVKKEVDKKKTTEPSYDGYRVLNKSRLLELCKEKGITCRKSWTKDKLINALLGNKTSYLERYFKITSGM